MAAADSDTPAFGRADPAGEFRLEGLQCRVHRAVSRRDAKLRSLGRKPVTCAGDTLVDREDAFGCALLVRELADREFCGDHLAGGICWSRSVQLNGFRKTVSTAQVWCKGSLRMRSMV